MDGGYGARFETTGVHPAFMGLAAPWHNPQQFDALMRKLSCTSLVGVLLRDRDGGRVAIYRISRYDQNHMQIALEAAARVLKAAGARDVFLTQSLSVSFHQMGTCRMGSRRRDSVVNAEGESWDVRDLFVADGSLFPSASGVNPMLTIAALGQHVAKAIMATHSRQAMV